MFVLSVYNPVLTSNLRHGLGEFYCPAKQVPLGPPVCRASTSCTAARLHGIVDSGQTILGRHIFRRSPASKRTSVLDCNGCGGYSVFQRRPLLVTQSHARVDYLSTMAHSVAAVTSAVQCISSDSMISFPTRSVYYGFIATDVSQQHPEFMCSEKIRTHAPSRLGRFRGEASGKVVMAQLFRRCGVAFFCGFREQGMASGSAMPGDRRHSNAPLMLAKFLPVDLGSDLSTAARFEQQLQNTLQTSAQRIWYM